VASHEEETALSAPPEPRYRGVFPVVPTTFTETGELDLTS
jgi:hypothetical protein